MSRVPPGSLGPGQHLPRPSVEPAFQAAGLSSETDDFQAAPQGSRPARSKPKVNTFLELCFPPSSSYFPSARPLGVGKFLAETERLTVPRMDVVRDVGVQKICVAGARVF